MEFGHALNGKIKLTFSLLTKDYLQLLHVQFSNIGPSYIQSGQVWTTLLQQKQHSKYRLGHKKADELGVCQQYIWSLTSGSVV